MKKLLSLLLVLAMAFSLVACGTTDTAETTAAIETTEAAAETTAASAEVSDADVTVLGEGETVFSLTVVDVDGTEAAFEIHTNETIVGTALLALELISGEDSEYGLYVKEVNGITADWDTDGTYWAFYVNGEYALTGVDSTEIDTTAAYSFVKTAG